MHTHVLAKRAEVTPEMARAYRNEFLNNALWGAGLTASGAALYQLIKGLRKAKMVKKPELVVAPAARAQPQPEEELKTAGAKENLETESAGGFDKNALLGLWRLGGPTANPYGPDYVPDAGYLQSGSRTAMHVLGLGLGGYAGLKLIKTLAKKMEEKNRDDAVEQARKDYFNALTGKQAQALDEIYMQIKTASGEKKYLPNIGTRWLRGMDQTGKDIWRLELLATLAAGGLGAKFIYDRTKAMSNAETLRKAQQAKNRLQSIQQSPWIDPEELATVAGR